MAADVLEQFAAVTLSKMMADVDPVSTNVQLMVIEAQMMGVEQGLDAGEMMQYFVALLDEYLELLPDMHESQDPSTHDGFMQATEQCVLHCISRQLL